MKIACCIIIKDDSELPDLIKAINTIYSYVDQVFITATGEKTEQIKDYCKQNKDLFYSYFKWTDSFSDARNFNFDQAQKHDNYD